MRSGGRLCRAAIIGSEGADEGRRFIKFVPVTVKLGPAYRIEYGGDTEQISREVLRRERMS
jgi:hypothetical protein